MIHELYKFEMENFRRDIADIRINVVLRSNLKTVNLDSPIATEAAELRCKHRDLLLADAIIAATALETSSGFILTNDTYFKEIKEIKTGWI